LATRRAVYTGHRAEDAVLHSKLRPDAPVSVEALFDRYHGTVYGLAMSILMSRIDAEEATRDVFLAVVRKADRLREDSWNHSWIYRICVNTCLKRLRKGRVTEIVPIREFLPVFTAEGAHANPIEDWSREVEHRTPPKEIGQVIGRFAATLPEKYLVVFALGEVQGFSCEETARVLNLTIAEVKSRLHRVRLYLRERLGRYLRDGAGI
jgi:RNA polymerase sigma-70 factor (ECF subfamily)